MPEQGAIHKKRPLFQRVRHSIFPSYLQPVKDREGYRRFFNTLVFHFRPRTVPERTLELTLTWGLAGMAVVLVLMLMGTGVLLKFVYEPLPRKALELILASPSNKISNDIIRLNNISNFR